MSSDPRACCCAGCYIVPELCGVPPNLGGCFGSCREPWCWGQNPERCVSSLDFGAPPDCECIEEAGPCCPCSSLCGFPNPPPDCCPRACDFRIPAPGSHPEGIPFNSTNSCMPNAIFCQGANQGLPGCEPIESGAAKRPYIACDLAPGVSCSSASPADCLNIPWASGCDTDDDGEKDFIVFKHKIETWIDLIGVGEWEYCYWIHKNFPHKMVNTCEDVKYTPCHDGSPGEEVVTEARTCFENIADVVPEGESGEDYWWPSCFRCCGCNCAQYCYQTVIGYDPCLTQPIPDDDPNPDPYPEIGMCQDDYNMLLTASITDVGANTCVCLCRQNDSAFCIECDFVLGEECPLNPNFQEPIFGCDPDHRCPLCWCDPNDCCDEVFDGFWPHGGGCITGNCNFTICLKRADPRGCPQWCIDDVPLPGVVSDPDNFCCSLNCDGDQEAAPFCRKCSNAGSEEYHWATTAHFDETCGGCVSDANDENAPEHCRGDITAGLHCSSTQHWSITIDSHPAFCCGGTGPCLGETFDCSTGDRALVFISTDEDACKCPDNIEEWVIDVIGTCIAGGSLTGQLSRVTTCP